MYYNPYQYQSQPMPMPQQSRMELIKVNGIESARAYQMPPNSTVALFDANNDVFYIRSTDGAGFPTIRAFDFHEHIEAQATPVDYVTRQEFNELIERIEKNGKQSVSE